jgi:predicted enzyme related to lactoylglutathione lyase
MATNQEARGRFGWFDLMTSYVSSATEFYTKVVGWELESWSGAGGDMPPYTMWKGPKGPFGGAMSLPDDAKKMGAPPNWMGYVIVPDLDATLAKAGELGARVLMPPKSIPTVGRFAVIADPQGAVIAPFQSEGDAPGHDEAPAVGEVAWRELMTTDPDKAFDFYATLFGWEKGEAMDMGAEMGGIYQIYARKGMPLGGMFKKPAEMPGPSFWLYYFRVADLDASIEKVKTLGGQLLNGPMEVPGGDRVAQMADPQGAAFALHQMK